MTNKPGRKPTHTDCKIDGCDKKHYARHLCAAHYSRFLKTGDPLPKEKTLCECGREAVGRGMCKRCYQSWYYYNRQGRSEGNKWHKVEVGYNGAHGRVRAVRGLASDNSCVLCGERATDWALSADAGDLRYGTSGHHADTAYSLNVYDYLPMCSDCHKGYDADTGNRSYKTGQYARYRQ